MIANKLISKKFININMRIKPLVIVLGFITTSLLLTTYANAMSTSKSGNHDAT